MPIKHHGVEPADELRPAYDLATLKHRVRGKHYALATAGVTLVRLESDVAAAFPTGRAVNEALRCVLLAKRKAAQASKVVPPTSRIKRPSKSRRPSHSDRG